ncbi:MAG: methylmalonyl-CoA mutase family protein [Bernardetiaceae bacterium]
MPDLPIFDDFLPADKAAWEAQLTKEKTSSEQLQHQTSEGLTLEALYTRQELSHTPTQQLANQTLNEQMPALGARHWYNQPIITVSDPKQANADALEALAQGADAVLFDLREETPDWATLTKDILFDYCRISFRISPEQDANAILPSILDLGVKAGSFLTTTPELDHLHQARDGFRTLVLTTTQSTDADRIADLLLQVKQWADVCPPERVWASTEIALTMTHDYFGNLTLLRALRFLLSQMAHQYGLSTESLPVHVFTGQAAVSLPPADTHWMLSNTGQAMAAILGGAAALTVIPHVEESRLAQRVARNVSNVLKEESYFDKVADPVAGAYYIEQRTDQLARAAWQGFQERL